MIIDIPWALAVCICHSEGNSSRSSAPIDPKISGNVKNDLIKSSQETDFGILVKTSRYQVIYEDFPDILLS